MGRWKIIGEAGQNGGDDPFGGEFSDRHLDRLQRHGDHLTAADS